MRFTRAILAAALVCMPLTIYGQGTGDGPPRLANASQISFDETGTTCTSENLQDLGEELCAGGGGGGGGSITLNLEGGGVESTALTAIAINNAPFCSESPPNGLLCDFTTLLLESELNSIGELQTLTGVNFVLESEGVSVLADVDTAGANVDDVLRFNGTNWIDALLTLTSLSDVDTTGAEVDKVLVFNGSSWVDDYVPPFIDAAVVDAFRQDTEWTTCDLDDCPGVADGAGADPNPFPGPRIGTIESGVLSTPSINVVNPIHGLSIYNFGNADPALYASTISVEYGYDALQRSGAEYVEFYWQFSPSTFRVTIASGGVGAIALGQNITFSNGAVCRPAQADADLSNGALVRMTCVDHVPPASGNTITACNGPSCTPTGTVSGAPSADSVPWRPFFYTLYTATNRVDWDQRRGVVDGTSTPLYWLSGQTGDNVLHLGRGGYADANYSRVSIPTASNASLGGPAGTMLSSGDITIDTSDAGVWTDAMISMGGQHCYGDGLFTQKCITPVKNHCYQFSNVSDTSDNVNIPLMTWQPSTVAAMSCRSDTTVTPTTNATMTVETLAGAAIGLNATLTCVGSASTATWQPVLVADADRLLPSGAGIRFDVGTAPNPSGDTYTVCVALQDTAK
jgi:hypothetical protein